MLFHVWLIPRLVYTNRWVNMTPRDLENNDKGFHSTNIEAATYNITVLGKYLKDQVKFFLTVAIMLFFNLIIFCLSAFVLCMLPQGSLDYREYQMR